MKNSLKDSFWQFVVLPCAVALLMLLSSSLAVISSAEAQESIRHYDVAIEIQRNGELRIKESIKVNVVGVKIKRGIFRDFPTEYQDRFRNYVRAGFKLERVTRDGKNDKFALESLTNGVRIRIGRADYLLPPGEYVYDIYYTTNRQVGFFEKHDELYFNAIGTDWAFPIYAADVSVKLPIAPESKEVILSAYTGYQGDRGTAYSAHYDSELGIASFKLTQPLADRQGMTIVVEFPKGIVAEITQMQKTLYFLEDNLDAAIGAVGLIIFSLIAYIMWVVVGRDPKPGVIIPQFEEPAGISPALARYIMKMGSDNETLTSGLISLGVKGWISIVDHGGSLTLRSRETENAKPLSPDEQELLAKLGLDRSELLLHHTNSSRVSNAVSAFGAKLKSLAANTYFHRNGWFTFLGCSFFALVLVAMIISQNGQLDRMFKASTILVVILWITALIIFGIVIKAYTMKGRKTRDLLEGFKMYLSTAEEDRLASLQKPGMSLELYEKFLPYAYALDCDHAWSEQVEKALGAAALESYRPDFYRGERFSTRSFSNFSGAVGAGIASAVVAASTPPGSSSGGGGGGSSGGGGGGGGGGGW